ncbi:hypothetical protein [Streptomyces brasiliscabiei]|uniref:Uncharacterized protein n=1 Tax=Streptomyces brasiliscabiei TaxID=2736302 RepID=A0ABU8GCM9_9ACTN
MPGEDRAWRRQRRPENVPVTLTGHFEVPCRAPRNRRRLSATVTVHRTALEAAWEQVGRLEEAVAPAARAGATPGERLAGLPSLPRGARTPT